MAIPTFHYRRFSKDELWLAAKVKGWTGERRKTQVGVFKQWLSEREVSAEDVRKINQAALSGKSGETQVIEKEVEVFKGVKLDEDVQQAIRAAVSAAHPHRIVLDGPAAKPVLLKERTHMQFEKVLRLVRSGQINVLLTGSAGCGKTFLAEQVARSMKRTFGTLHCSNGASESQLLGWRLPGKGGNFQYCPAEFVRLYEQGNSVFLLDEIDGADPNMLLVLNGALANGAVHVPQRFEAPHVQRGKNVAIIAAANTYGTGADMLYAGRNQLDAATLDRFYVVHMDYDRELEHELAGGDEQVLQFTWNLRAKIAEHRLRRVASTRMITKGAAAKKAGIPWKEVQRELLAGWTRDELLKAGV